MAFFTEEDVILEAKLRHGAPVCIDSLAQAMASETLNDAVDIILLDCYYCDGQPDIPDNWWDGNSSENKEIEAI
jgi:hypothetical protein